MHGVMQDRMMVFAVWMLSILKKYCVNDINSQFEFEGSTDE